MHHDQKSDSEQMNRGDQENTGKPDIQPSEVESGSDEQSEENAPGRTPGKAEGSVDTIEEELNEK